MKPHLPEATDFTDLPVLAKPEAPAASVIYPKGAEYVLCPLCHGHGRWNLLLNQYGPGRHFQAACRQCWSWGWVVAGSLDETCADHTYVAIKPSQPFRCWHTDRCTKCGRIVSYSSDD